MLEIGPLTAAHLRNPAFAAVDAHPFTGEFGRRYYPAVFGDGRRNESFVVSEAGQAGLLVLCTAGAGALDWYGMPIRLFPRDGAPVVAIDACVTAALARLDELARTQKAKTVSFFSPPGMDLGSICRARFYADAPRDFASADLTGGETALRKNLRKSFKSLLNWGKRSLTLETFDQSNPAPELFKRYQEFHAEIAGRTTRPQKSWAAMANWIAGGHGELILGSFDGKLVAGTMVVDGASVAFYASGVYDRSRFDKPLAHWPLWLGMAHAATRGLAIFDIGEIPRAGAASDKEVNIGYFKRGFAQTVATQTLWTRTFSAT